jgi:hypothetical protein
MCQIIRLINHFGALPQKSCGQCSAVTNKGSDEVTMWGSCLSLTQLLMANLHSFT